MKRVIRPKKPFYAVLGTMILVTFFILSPNSRNGNSKEQLFIHASSLPLKQMSEVEQLKKEINSMRQQTFLSITLDAHEHYIQKPVYLTFDDGPTKDTPYILDILKQFNVKATFFMLDGQMKRFPDITKRVVEEGHAVGCHGVSHDIRKIYAHDRSALQEMQQCSETLKAFTNVDSSLIRVPFGSVPYLKEPHRSQLKQARFQLWDWNVDSEDWNSKTPAQVIHNVLPALNRLEREGRTPIILFHDKEVTVHSLNEILTFTQQSGYQPILISEAMRPMEFRVR
ncbi:polysaccharide deacetylase family protein [Priestia abyssalis]|uniref:polysaccharide deacetylase family protein n=1 Tax=Priestia abyssalis TaxID=1221450 RepID=UPI00111793C4|nr:polysaccharide deacetylase family protein [Priestia abyssalis]